MTNSETNPVEFNPFDNTSKLTIEKNYFILNKQLYTSQRNNVTCKINFYEPSAIIKGEGPTAFHGIITQNDYIDRRYYDYISTGLYIFVYELAEHGHQFKLSAIKPYQG